MSKADTSRGAHQRQKHGGARVRRKRVRMADIDCEEFEEASTSPLPYPSDNRRQLNPPPPVFPVTTRSPISAIIFTAK